MVKYPKEVEESMIFLYHTLSEKDRRRYAALESLKLGHGGISYLASLFQCSRTTIHSGIREFQKGFSVPQDRVRKEGGGRKSIYEKTPQIHQVLEKILGYSIGENLDSTLETTLTSKEIVEQLAHHDIPISTTTVRNILKKLGIRQITHISGTNG